MVFFLLFDFERMVHKRSNITANAQGLILSESAAGSITSKNFKGCSAKLFFSSGFCTSENTQERLDSQLPVIVSVVDVMVSGVAVSGFSLFSVCSTIAS